MQKKIGAGIIVGMIAAVVGWIAFGTLYYIRDDSGGQLLWKSDEAYLFASVKRRGYRVRVLNFGWLALKEWLNVPPPLPTDQRVFLTVIRVSSSGIERHDHKVVEDGWYGPDFFTPIGETIYANCQGILCKWLGDRFENATPEEQKNLDGINRLSSDSVESINGWSKRGVGEVAGDFHFSIEIGNGTRLRIQQGNVFRSTTDSATVYLDRTGQPSQQLWHVNGAPRRVTKREYEQVLFNP
jgi:hypothetical protein